MYTYSVLWVCLSLRRSLWKNQSGKLVALSQSWDYHNAGWPQSGQTGLWEPRWKYADGFRRSHFQLFCNSHVVRRTSQQTCGFQHFPMTAPSTKRTVFYIQSCSGTFLVGQGCYGSQVQRNTRTLLSWMSICRNFFPSIFTSHRTFG